VETISFARGVPAPECLPVDELADCARVVLERDGRTVLSYGAAGGYAPLREWVARRHGVSPARVLLTNGSLQGLVFLATHLLGGPSRRVLVEAPTYDRTLTLLARLGAEVEALPLDDEGLDVDALEAALDTSPPPAFLYTIPTFQNPTGRTLSAARRARLAGLARERALLVVEDDPYGLVRFEGEPLQTVFELAGGEGVAYASSFSKTVAPGLRVGYLVLPDRLAAPVEALAVSTYVTPGLLPQATVHEFLRRNGLTPSIRRVCSLLRLRRDAMLEALADRLPSGASWTRPEGGYFLWLDLPAGVEASDLLARAADAGVTFVQGSDFYPCGRGGEFAARLAYSFVSPEEIRAGVERLAPLIATSASGRPARAGARPALRSPG
jgi:DNA-binding transcriptional MocR family regulator